MNMLTKRSYQALLLMSTVFFHGCTSSSLVDTKDQDHSKAPAAVTAASPQAVEKRISASRPTELEDNIRHMQVKGMARKSKMNTISPLIAAEAANYRGLNDRRPVPPFYPGLQQESYNAVTENVFITTLNDPLSTFSIDVDTAAYANVRRWLNGGQLPPVGAVRIEEMINYFSYQYPEPKNGPIAITAEVGPCPWQPANKLVRIGLKAKELDQANIPPSNLVFLIDVSGSMNQPNKLPLLQQSMMMLASKLTAQDRVSIVVYAGADRVVLQPTWGDKRAAIRKAITNLSAGGSTHASSGILTAYQLARQSFIKDGNNRIILASDGDFNVGVTSRGELERLIVKERESGVYLTVLGFGMGNYHDDTMEILADKGNGNYSYIDSLLEAKKVLIKERAGTLFTLARDVKLQLEFNPSRVAGYRLIGYENRVLADEDFNNDKKDAGEIGAGHTVTALYELLPVGSTAVPKVDPLKYQQKSLAVDNSNELLTLKLRYKPLTTNQSILMTKAVNDNTLSSSTTEDFHFASAVAGFGMLLRHSSHVAQLSYAQLIAIARKGRGADNEGYRAEFIHLLETSELLQNKS